MSYTTTKVPDGQKITLEGGRMQVPDRPIIPFIRGDGTGPDIWRASQAVLDASVQKAYGGRRAIAWMEVFAGEESFNRFNNWLPDDTVAAFREFRVGIKGPLTTPVGGGIRSLNVALRQLLDLYVCLRPVRWFHGVPSPVRHPEKVDMVIFRENTEDIYAGIEYAGGSPEAQKVLDFLSREFPKDFAKVRFGTPDAGKAFLSMLGRTDLDASTCVGIGIKPISRLGAERLIHSAICYAIKTGRRSVTLVHKGNIMKFTEGAFRDWGYALATREFRAQVVTERESWILGNLERNPALSAEENARMVEPGYDMAPPEAQAELRAEVEAAMALRESHGGGKHEKMLKIRDSIADITLQQVLTRPDDFSVIATPNLNGDYLSDALAAQVGGIGIAPGGNINYVTGHAIFEATHGTAPKYANKDVVNPGSVILSGVMMLEHMGWQEAADMILRGLERAIASKHVTYDFARLMEGATQVKCSEFGERIIAMM